MQFLGLSSSQWLDAGISALVVVLVPILGRWVVSFLLGRVLHRLVIRTDTDLDDMLLSAVRPPVHWLLFVGVLHWSIARLDFLPAGWDTFRGNLFFLLYLGIFCILALRVVARFFTWYGGQVEIRSETVLAKQMLPFSRRLVMALVGIIALIILLGRFDIDASAFITTLGIGSLAIALAAQAALADTISGFLIIIDRPFRIGDRIEIRDLSTWGDVVDIGLRSTRIRTRDNRTVIVPNSVIEKSLVVNHSYPDALYRIQMDVGVAYGTSIALARDTLVRAVQQAEDVLAKPPPEALFLSFDDSALTFRVRCWIADFSRHRFALDQVNTAVYDALGEAGILIPFPQRDVHFKVDAADADIVAAALRSPAVSGMDSSSG